MNQPLVLKLGGELLESPDQRARIAALAAVVSASRPLVVVHGGGRAIDQELDRRQIAPRKVDGLRITDTPTLQVVVSVLAGAANTDLVAAMGDAGVMAVGLTGVDAGLARAARTPAYRSASGDVVDLGHVGDPEDIDPALIRLLLAHGYVPIIASIGIEEMSPEAPASGVRLLNINADVMAAQVAASLGPCDLVIAGGTPGVLDGNGASIPSLDIDGIDGVIASGTATAGMVAKLSACRNALLTGVASVRIIDGRTLDATHAIESAAGTSLRNFSMSERN